MSWPIQLGIVSFFAYFLNLDMNIFAQMYPTVPPTKQPTITPEYIPVTPHPKMKQKMYANTVSRIRDLKSVIKRE